MLTRRRLLVVLPVVLLAAACAYTAWQAWGVRHDLTRAQASATRLRAALDDRDTTSRDAAIRDLRASASSARSRTDGEWWGALTHLPLVGDDATGVRALSRSLDTIATEGVTPLGDSADRLEHLSVHGRIDVGVVRGMTDPVSTAYHAFATANHEVADLDSSGYAGPLRSRFDDYVELVADATSVLASAQKALAVLPGMIGADGPRDYLLVFQNNAEIRATGGMPGSWALVHAEDGRLSMTRQGAARDFGGERRTPVLPLSKPELALFHEQLGTYFQDAGFVADFPRAAQLWTARWQETFPGTDLDGVLALDPVGMSYLLDGTGPIAVGKTTLTSDNVVDELLNKPYVELDTERQDELFRNAAKAIFQASTRELASPLKFVEGLSRAGTEGRFLVAPSHAVERQALAGTRVAGELAGDDGDTPHVDIGLNDATGSKMSYYLRYWDEVRTTACDAGTQTLNGTMTLMQAVSPSEAKALPVSVTGTGGFGTERGSQLVVVHLYGPYGGSIDHLSLDGKSFDKDLKTVELDGRPVTQVVVLLSNRDDIVINWTMTTGPGQRGDVEVGLTPSVVAGDKATNVRSAC